MGTSEERRISILQGEQN